MIPSFEPLLCPCCTAATVQSLSQYGFQTFSDLVSLLGTRALSTLVGLNKETQAPAMSTELLHDSPSQIQS